MFGGLQNCCIFVPTKTNKYFSIMNTQTTKNNNNKKQNIFAYVVTTITIIIWLGGSINIFAAL